MGKMTDKEIEKAALSIKDLLSGMTVNERLWKSGLMEIYDECLKSDRSKAKWILELLDVDAESIEKIVKGERK